MKDAWGSIMLIALLAMAGPVSAGERIFVPGETLKVVSDHGAGEGPAWHPELGLLTSGGSVYRHSREGETTVFLEDAGTNGLLFDRQGRLLACQPSQRRVIRRELDGTITELTGMYEGVPYNQPNDLSVDSQNRIYFTDPQYGSRESMKMVDREGTKIEGVYRIDLDGSVTRILTHEVDRPNGVLVSPDDRYLFVADNNNNTQGAARRLYRFRLQADGSVDLESQKLLFDWHDGRGPDGLVQDVKGRLYVAGGRTEAAPPFENVDFAGGVYVFSPRGKLLDFVAVPTDEVTNCTFGGDDLRTLYITAGGTLYSIRTQTAGWLPWPQQEKDK
jgi:gluconolactonase